MGFFNSFFSSTKSEPSHVEPMLPKPVDPNITEISDTVGLNLDIVAVIGASVAVMMEDEAEIIAAVTATIVHAHTRVLAVRIKRNGNAWAALGRQKIMDSRQMLIK